MANMAKIKIVKVPRGDAPVWVREQWVGLELPLAQRRRGALRVPSWSVLSAPTTWLGDIVGFLAGRSTRERGYAVPVLAALEILGTVSPDAEEWWRTTTPHLCKSWRRFLFNTEACEVIE